MRDRPLTVIPAEGLTLVNIAAAGVWLLALGAAFVVWRSVEWGRRMLAPRRGA